MNYVYATCAHCGVSFQQVRDHQRFCTDRCRVANHRYHAALGDRFVHVDPDNPCSPELEAKARLILNAGRKARGLPPLAED